MTTHQCLICTKFFKRKGHLEAHLNKKYKCKPNIELHLTSIKTVQNNIEQQQNCIGTHPTGIKTVQNNINSHPNSIKTVQNNIDSHSNSIKTVQTNIVQNNAVQNNLEQSENNISSTKIHKCEYCMKTFTRKYVLSLHIKKYCKVAIQRNKEKEDIIKQFEEKIKKLEEENEKLKEEKNKEPCSITINNVSNNINNINNINITMVSHGKENPMHKTLLLLLASKRGLTAIPELIKRMHFNNDYPEFQNVYIPSIKDKHTMVYDNKWVMKDTNDVVSDMYEDKKNFMIDNKDIFYNELADHEKRSYDKWIDYDKNKETSEDAKAFITETYARIKYILFNDKDIPIATKKRFKELDKNN